MNSVPSLLQSFASVIIWCAMFKGNGLFLRILLVAVAAFAASSASAQENRRDHRKKSPTAPTDQVALDPTNAGAAPLPNLPALPGQTWRHWIVPHFSASNSNDKKTSYSLRISNIGNSTVTADVECYVGGSRKTKAKKIIKPRGEAHVNEPVGWCRVSANKPVLVYGLEAYTEYVYNHERDGGARPSFYRQIIQGIPYPAE